MFDWREYGNGIFAFDSGYIRPTLAAIHLIVEKNRVAFIDTGTNNSLPNAMGALKKLGLDGESVDYVILTHIHLDHAGGAGAMMQAFPKATLIVHPRGGRHMAEPSKLVAAVSAVYGEDYVQQVYGKIMPVSQERIVEADDGFQLSLAGRKLICLDTPGHARHHICIVDDRTGGIFTGDLFGLSYRELDVDGHQFIFPTTSPSQFDPEAMHSSIDRLLQLNPSVMYATHYGQLHDVNELASALRRRLNAVIEMAVAERYAGESRHERIKAAMTRYVLSEIRNHNCKLSDKKLLEIWETDIELNTQGMEVWLDSK